MTTTDAVAEAIATGDAEADPEPGGQPLGIGLATRTWRSALMVLGGVAGLGVAWTDPDRGSAPQWYIWAAIAILLGIVSGSSLGSGVARRHDVNEIEPVSLLRVLPSLSFFLLLAIVAFPLSTLFLGDRALTWRGVAFAVIAIVGALPAGGALATIRVLALRGLHGTVGRQLTGLLVLRRLLGRLLTILGSLVVLVTLVNAAALKWGHGRTIPSGAVLFVGAAGAVLTAIVYIPTATLLRRRCAVFIDQHFSLDGVSRADLVAAVEERTKMEELLGVNRTTLGELQAGLLIIFPLLASAGLSLLPALNWPVR